MLGEGTHGLGHDAVAVGGIGSLIGVELHLPGGEGAVLAEPRDDVEADGVAHTVGDEGLLTGAVHPDTAAVDLRGAPGAQGFIEGVLLVAEAAADIGLHHPDIAPRAAQRLSHHTADDMGDLGRGYHRDTAVLLVGEAAVVFDVAMLHRGRLIPALHLNEARLLNGGLIVARLHIGVLEDVVGVGLVEPGSVRLHGLLHIQHEGQLLVFHLQRPDALHGGHLVFCNDHRHVVAVVADVPVQQVAVRHVLMAGVHGPGVARRGERVLRHVETGQYLHHAGDLLRRRGVHRLDEAVGNGGVLDADIQRITGITIVLIAVGAGFAVVASQDAAVNSRVKDAICNFQFDTAETLRGDVKLFPAGDNSLRTEIIRTGRLYQAGQYTQALMYLDDLRETYTDAGLAAYSGVLDTIEAKSLPQIYAAAAEAYSAQDYQTALADYTVLAARNYSDSDKRLFLTNAHLCDSLGQLALAAGMTNAQAAQKLMELIGFSDTNQVIMRDDSYAQAFLTGSWSSDAGELTVADDGTVTCSLPGLSGKECSLRDGAIYAGTGEDAVAFYRFSVLSDRMMIADAVGDGRAYTMFRQ